MGSTSSNAPTSSNPQPPPIEHIPDTSIGAKRHIIKAKTGSLTADFEERIKGLGKIFQNVNVDKAKCVDRYNLSPEYENKLMVDEALQVKRITHDVAAQTADLPQEGSAAATPEHAGPPLDADPPPGLAAVTRPGSVPRSAAAESWSARGPLVLDPGVLPLSHGFFRRARPARPALISAGPFCPSRA